MSRQCISGILTYIYAIQKQSQVQLAAVTSDKRTWKVLHRSQVASVSNERALYGFMGSRCWCLRGSLSYAV